MPYKDPEKAKEFHRKWQANYRAQNPEKVRLSLLKWKTKNPDRYKAVMKKHANSKKHNDYMRGYNKTKREKSLEILGSRCSNPDCGWINKDGSRGCTDERCLQIDHINGDGPALRKQFGNGSLALHADIVKDIKHERYQLLCANCNWIKRHINKEHVKGKFEVAGVTI